jgi:outer membrane protein TolC
MRAIEACLIAVGACSWGVPGVAAGPSDTLSVEDCAALARHRAPAVVAADLARQAAVFESAAVARNRRPELAFVGRALVAPKGFYDPVITNLGEYETKLVLDYAVLDGGLRARARARGALDLEQARLEAAVQGRDVGLQAADLAIQILRLGEVEEAHRQSLDWIGRLSLLMRGAVRAGARSTTDSVRIALERATGETALETTLSARRTAEIDLAALLGISPDSIAVRPPDFPIRPPAAEDSIRILSTAPRQPEVALARIEEERGRLDLVEARRTLAPTVDLSLDAGLSGADLTSTVPEDLRATDPDATFADRLRRDLGASASINLRAPIISAGAGQRARGKRITLEAARVRSAAALAGQEKTALEIMVRWRYASRRLEAARLASAGAEKNLLRLKSLYTGGAVQLLDLLDGRRVDQEARQALAEAREESRSAQFRAEDRP